MTTSPYRAIVVGTDGSPTATTAVRIAANIARVSGVPLSIVTGWRRDRDDAPPASEESQYPGGSAASNEASWASATASEAAAVARGVGVEDVRQHTPAGSPADVLIGVAEDAGDVLLVVGSAGLTVRAERLVGNVPHQLTHHAPCDLLIVDSSVARDGLPWKTVALATDGSDTAATACRRGLALSRVLVATPTLLTVARDDADGQRTLDRAAGHLDTAVDRRVITDRDAAAGLTEVAPSYDLLVIGNKGMSGPSRLLGSVSNKVTHGVPTDLLLVNTTR